MFKSRKDETTKTESCMDAREKITSQTYIGSFFPCTTDGLEREYPAKAVFAIRSNLLDMHLIVDSLNIDTVINYEFWCEHYAREPYEKTYLKFEDSAKTSLSDYNLYHNKVCAWFQYEPNCEKGLFFYAKE